MKFGNLGFWWNHWDRFLIPGAINNECVGFSIIEIEKLCKESTECKAEQAYVRNQKPLTRDFFPKKYLDQ